MNSKFLVPDLRSGIVVFLVALPLCLGISMACGAPLFSGIIAGIIGGTVVTLFSASKFSVSGPAAGLTAIVITSVAELGSFQSFVAAIVMAGALQVAFGLFKTGSISNFIPSTVIKGMLAGIGIILIIKQLPHVVGYDADPEGDMYFEQLDGHNSISDLYYMLNYITPGAVVTGLVCFCFLLIANKPFYKNHRVLALIPGPLLAVLSGILLNMCFSGHAVLNIGEQHTVSLPDLHSLSDLKRIIILPDFTQIGTHTFWMVVVTLAVVASLETLLNLEAVEKLDPEKQAINPNRELVAQGIGNIVSGCVGGLPVTSVIVRSSANIHAGAKTKWSSVLHAVLLLLSVLLFPGLLRLIPNAALAAILIFTGYKLTKVSLFTAQFRAGWDQFLPFITTIVVMLLTDLLKGVGAGIVVAVIFIIRASIRSSFEIIEEQINGRINYLVKLPQHITFFNKGFVINYLHTIKNGSRVIIDGSINKSTDKDVKEVLATFVETSAQKNIEIQLVKYNI
jgi:MFS superfamily sulfate permease-like transporter